MLAAEVCIGRAAMDRIGFAPDRISRCVSWGRGNWLCYRVIDNCSVRRDFFQRHYVSLFYHICVCSQQQCEAFVAELMAKAREMGATEEQHRLDSCWRVIFEGCFQFDPAKRSWSD